VPRFAITYRYRTSDPYYHGERSTTVEAENDAAARQIIRDAIAPIGVARFVRVREIATPGTGWANSAAHYG
jgi:hypothetical protein